MNRNKTKKIRVLFPTEWFLHEVEREARKKVLKFLAPLDINTRIELSKKALSDVFAGPSNILVGSQHLPKIEGFDCTWIRNNFGILAQFTFANAEEQKLMRIITKYNGKIFDPDEKLHQHQIEETNGSGKINQVELANEILKRNSFG